MIEKAEKEAEAVGKVEEQKEEEEERRRRRVETGISF